VSIPNDADPDLLISRLSGPLAPDARRAFRQAAEALLAATPCSGPGALYRALAPLQKQFFNPPGDDRAAWDISSGVSVRPSKLRSGPALGFGRSSDRVYRKRHLRAVG
jgi:hypothetical protein